MFYSDISFVARLSAIDISGCILIYDIYELSYTIKKCLDIYQKRSSLRVYVNSFFQSTKKMHGVSTNSVRAIASLNVYSIVPSDFGHSTRWWSILYLNVKGHMVQRNLY